MQQTSKNLSEKIKEIKEDEKILLKHFGAQNNTELTNQIKKNQNTDYMALLKDVVDLKQTSIKGMRTTFTNTDYQEIKKMMKNKGMNDNQASVNRFLQKQLKTAQEVLSAYNTILDQLADVKNVTVKELKSDVAQTEKAIKKIKDAIKAEPRTLKEYTTLTSGLNRYFWGHINEPLVGFAVNEAYVNLQSNTKQYLKSMVPKDIKSGKIAAGGSSWGKGKLRKIFFTTDATFEIGDVVYGIDIKRSREIYTKSFTSKDRVFDGMITMLGGGKMFNSIGEKTIGVKNDETLKRLMYAVVNYGVFAAAGAKELKKEVVNPLTAIILVSDLINFIDQYIKTIDTTNSDDKNKGRKQLIIAMGDDFYMVSDLILNIQKDLESRVYDMDKGAGWINLDIGSGGVASISETKREILWNSKLSKIEGWKNKKTDLNGYPALFNHIYSDKSSGANEMVVKILRSKMSTWGSIDF